MATYNGLRIIIKIFALEQQGMFALSNEPSAFEMFSSSTSLVTLAKTLMLFSYLMFVHVIVATISQFWMTTSKSLQLVFWHMPPSANVNCCPCCTSVLCIDLLKTNSPLQATTHQVFFASAFCTNNTMFKHAFISTLDVVLHLLFDLSLLPN